MGLLVRQWQGPGWLSHTKELQQAPMQRRARPGSWHGLGMYMPREGHIGAAPPMRAPLLSSCLVAQLTMNPTQLRDVCVWLIHAHYYLNTLWLPSLWCCF
jgi:hypothetical protein